MPQVECDAVGEPKVAAQGRTQVSTEGDKKPEVKACFD